MLEELDSLLDALMNIDDKLNELQRINSMVIVTCDACENGNDIKYDVEMSWYLFKNKLIP